MITVVTQGGLGNQMFQYAMGLAQANRLQTSLQIDRGINGLNSFRPFNLNLFQVPEPTVENLGGEILVERSLGYDENIDSKVRDGAHLLGYWQNEKYFQSIASTIRLRFRSAQPWTVEAGKFADKIASAGRASTFLGVRRTDYVTNPAANAFQGLMEYEYFWRALEVVRAKTWEDPVVFVFSDDIDWVKKNYRFRFPTYYWQGDMTVAGRMGREDIDLGLMAMCNNAVIPNSSFSWWGAWLGDKNRRSGTVVAPQRWFKDPVAQSQMQIVPDRWTKL